MKAFQLLKKIRQKIQIILSFLIYMQFTDEASQRILSLRPNFFKKDLSGSLVNFVVYSEAKCKILDSGSAPKVRHLRKKVRIFSFLKVNENFECDFFDFANFFSDLKSVGTPQLGFEIFLSFFNIPEEVLHKVSNISDKIRFQNKAEVAIRLGNTNMIMSKQNYWLFKQKFLKNFLYHSDKI